jgi:hypothetical protein
MDAAEDIPMTIDEMAGRLKCSRGWVQLSIDAGCPQDAEGRINIRDFMLFQLSNIHRIRELAGLSRMEAVGEPSDLRPNVKAILTTQLEWLQARSTKSSVKQAAKMVYDKMRTVEDA